MLCSGRITWDLMVERPQLEGDSPTTAIARFEQLYPRPGGGAVAEIGRFPNLKEIRWVQDEPANMGPSPHIPLNLFPNLDHEVQIISRPGGAAVGRPAHPSRGQPKGIMSEAFADVRGKAEENY